MAGRGGRREGSGAKRGKRPLTVMKEQVAAAVIEHNVARKGDKKLAVDVLEEFMNLFAGMAAHHQPHPVALGSPNPNTNYDEEKFRDYADRAVECARALSKHQTPTYKAIAVMTTPAPMEQQAALPRPKGENVVDLNDINRLTQNYLRMVKSSDRRRA